MLTMIQCSVVFSHKHILAPVFLLRTLRRRSAKLSAGRDVAVKHVDPEVQSKNSSGGESVNDVFTSPSDDATALAALRKWDVVALEAGIIFHSILIGEL